MAYSLIIISIMIVIVSSISTVTVLEKKGAVSTDSSVQAYQVADSGTQLAIKTINQSIIVDPARSITATFGSCNIPTGEVTRAVPAVSGSNYTLSFKDSVGTALDCSDEIQDIRNIKSVGTYKNTVRAVEVAVSGINCDADTVCGMSCMYNGDEYSTVEIGTQCWFQQNLKTKKKPDATTAVSTWDPNNDSNNVADYGLLYQWTGANDLADSCATSSSCPLPSPNQGICPAGWHIPKVAEFETLRSSTQGNTLRDANNFNGVLAGFFWMSSYTGFDARGLWWSADESNATHARYLNLNTDNTSSIPSFFKTMAASVRCIQD